MAGEAVTQDQVGHVRVWADQRVLVEGVVLVEAGPRRLHLEATKSVAAAVERWPDDLLKDCVVDHLEIGHSGTIGVATFGRGRDATQEAARRALRPKPHPRGVDNEPC
eukprot:CAMPEP_0119096330 /NCGR_PEP_ID=MMETSP1178-20130426/172547_1 /TAXON_ID=33656 /ORGANISM="unid sp, Strain CCMP2000" /LENGTH=107 /DNA_ID=CAMNT_0007080207 /DNA_START=239 /DNA_END=559 /DNA_ORIENTATION=+